MKYYSEILNRMFNSENELITAEQEEKNKEFYIKQLEREEQKYNNAAREFAMAEHKFEVAKEKYERAKKELQPLIGGIPAPLRGLRVKMPVIDENFVQENLNKAKDLWGDAKDWFAKEFGMSEDALMEIFNSIAEEIAEEVAEEDSDEIQPAEAEAKDNCCGCEGKCECESGQNECSVTCDIEEPMAIDVLAKIFGIL